MYCRYLRQTIYSIEMFYYIQCISSVCVIHGVNLNFAKNWELAEHIINYFCKFIYTLTFWSTMQVVLTNCQAWNFIKQICYSFKFKFGSKELLDISRVLVAKFVFDFVSPSAIANKMENTVKLSDLFQTNQRMTRHGYLVEECSSPVQDSRD